MPTLEDLRPLYCQLGYSTKSDGSAQLSQGRTTVLAGVYGPVEVKRNREKPDRMDVEVTLQPRVGQSCVENRTREAMIRDITEACVKLVLHPRAGVNLSIHVLEQDEGVKFDKVFNEMGTKQHIKYIPCGPAMLSRRKSSGDPPETLSKGSPDFLG